VRRRIRGRGSVVLGLGPHDLPGTLDEMTELSSDARLLSGPLATRASLATALVEYDLVHVAGHGFDAPEAPPLGGVRVADGWFTAADVPARIGARTVVLAACRTGLVHGVPGRAWGGLPSALLAAGARAVLWTADDVEDRVTADLMRRFHRARRGTTVPRALGLALERTWNARGHAGGLLPFRISGVGS
jgi:CHAT domain-containing protein